jgi:hypothetical protein
MKILAVEMTSGGDMLQLMDPLAVRLQGEARRADLRASMQASREGTVRRRVGGWLVVLGGRLAPERAGLQPAADCG